jgi:hypothetical protein
MRFQFQVEVAHAPAPDFLNNADTIHQVLRRDQMAFNFHCVIGADAEITRRQAGGNRTRLDQNGRSLYHHGRIAWHSNFHEANPTQRFKPSLTTPHGQHHVAHAEVFYRIFAIESYNPCAFGEAHHLLPTLCVNRVGLISIERETASLNQECPVFTKIERILPVAANQRVTAGIIGRIAQVIFIPAAESQPIIAGAA